jgi:ABC-type phosphate transport system permease subunit
MTEFLTTPIVNVAVWHMIYMLTIGVCLGMNIGVYLTVRQDRKLKEKYDDTYDDY